MSEVPQWLREHREQLHATQDGQPRQVIAAELARESEYVFDPETAAPVTHRWVDRGMKLSCEGANHPMHQVWKQRTKAVRM